MKTTIAALILAAAAVTPAAAGEYIDSSAQPVHAATNAMDAYASASLVNWHKAQEAYIRRQTQIQWEVSDR